MVIVFQGKNSREKFKKKIQVRVRPTHFFFIFASMTSYREDLTKALSPFFIDPLIKMVLDYCLVDCLFVRVDGTRIYDSRQASELLYFRDSFNSSVFGNLFSQIQENEVDLSEWCVHPVTESLNQIRVLHKQTARQCANHKFVMLDWLAVADGLKKQSVAKNQKKKRNP
jgi:hypothetical protein